MDRQIINEMIITVDRDTAPPKRMGGGGRGKGTWGTSPARFATNASTSIEAHTALRNKTLPRSDPNFATHNAASVSPSRQRDSSERKRRTPTTTAAGTGTSNNTTTSTTANINIRLASANTTAAATQPILQLDDDAAENDGRELYTQGKAGEEGT